MPGGRRLPWRASASFLGSGANQARMLAALLLMIEWERKSAGLNAGCTNVAHSVSSGAGAPVARDDRPPLRSPGRLYGKARSRRADVS